MTQARIPVVHVDVVGPGRALILAEGKWSGRVGRRSSGRGFYVEDADAETIVVTHARTYEQAGAKFAHHHGISPVRIEVEFEKS